MGVLLSALIYIIVIGLVVWLALYVLDQMPVAEPFNRVARVVIIAIAVILVILMLLSLVDSGPVRFPRF